MQPFPGASHRPACQAGGSKRRRRGIGGGEVKLSLELGRNARASHCSALPRVDFPAATLAEASAGSGEPKR